MVGTELTLEDFYLLAALEQQSTLSHLATQFKRDKSVISRKLKDLSGKSKVIEKIAGQWRLTELGRKLTKLALDFDAEQKNILGQPTKLTIAGSRLFISTFLANRLDQLQTLFPNKRLSLISHDGPPEDLLLKGRCDLAFSCGKPQDPSVAFRRTIKEPFYAFAANSFLRKYKVRDFASLQATPHFAFMIPNGSLPFSDFLAEHTPLYATSNDPVAILNAVNAGYCWSVMPYYGIEELITSKRGRLFEDGVIEVEQYGVWWLRSRNSHSALAQKALTWLSSQRLEPLPH